MDGECVVASDKKAGQVKPRVPAQRVTCFCSEDVGDQAFNARGKG